MPSQREGTHGSPEAQHEALLRASIAAARGAAAFIREQAHDLGRIDWRLKQAADFVSDVDTGAETRIRDSLLGAFPAGSTG